MNLLEMQTMVSALAGDESKVQFTDAQITQYLNWATGEIGRRLEILQKTVAFTALDATDVLGGVVMPADFDQELHVFWNGIPLSRTDFADYYSDYTGSASNENATYYTLQNYAIPASPTAGSTRRMLFYPYQPPGRTGLNINVMYQSLPTALAGPTDVCNLPAICHEVVCLYALSRCKLQENDYTAYQMIAKDVYNKLMELSTLMDESNAFSYPVVRSETGSVSRSDA